MYSTSIFWMKNQAFQGIHLLQKYKVSLKKSTDVISSLSNCEKTTVCGHVLYLGWEKICERVYTCILIVLIVFINAILYISTLCISMLVMVPETSSKIFTFKTFAR